jgi:hypothetical protein
MNDVLGYCFCSFCALIFHTHQTIMDHNGCIVESCFYDSRAVVPCQSFSSLLVASKFHKAT